MPQLNLNELAIVDKATFDTIVEKMESTSYPFTSGMLYVFSLPISNFDHALRAIRTHDSKPSELRNMGMIETPKLDLLNYTNVLALLSNCIASYGALVKSSDYWSAVPRVDTAEQFDKLESVGNFKSVTIDQLGDYELLAVVKLLVVYHGRNYGLILNSESEMVSDKEPLVLRS